MITFHRFTAQMQFVMNMHRCRERKVNMQKSLKICKCLTLIIRILIILLLGTPQTITFSYITTSLPIAIQTCIYWLSQKECLVLSFVQDCRNHAVMIWVADTQGSWDGGVPSKEVITPFFFTPFHYSTLKRHNRISEYNT